MDKIRDYVDTAFFSLPKTREAAEMKARILEHMQDSYSALMNEGKNEAEAFGTVILQFGSVEELRRELGEENAPQGLAGDSPLQAEYSAFGKRYAKFAALAVGLYILAVLVQQLTESYSETLSIVLFLIPVAAATSIFVYFGIRDSQYKAKLDLHPLQKVKGELKSECATLTGVIYLLATVIFLSVGFGRGLWHPGWIVFLVAAALVMLLEAHYGKRSRQ